MSMADLKELYDSYRTDPSFDDLRAPDINFVPGTGILNPTAMLIGEAPGADENARCLPFVGKAGSQLHRILKEVEIDISSLYFTNIVKYWSRDSNRKPKPPASEQIEYSKPYIEREIEIVNPAFVALCGLTSTRALYPNVVSMRQVAGKLIGRKYIPLYHPAVVLYKKEKYGEVLSGYKILSTLINTLE